MGTILRPDSPTLRRKSRIVEPSCASLEEMPKQVLDEPSGTRAQHEEES